MNPLDFLKLKPKRPRTKEAQYVIYLDFLEAHPDFLQQILSANPNAMAKGWNQLVIQLNSIDGAAKGSKEMWQSRFQDWLYHLLRKQRERFIEFIQTGGGPSKFKTNLKDYERRALALFNPSIPSDNSGLPVETGISEPVQPSEDCVIIEKKCPDLIKVIPTALLTEKNSTSAVKPSSIEVKVESQRDITNCGSSPSISKSQPLKRQGVNSAHPAIKKRRCVEALEEKILAFERVQREKDRKEREEDRKEREREREENRKEREKERMEREEDRKERQKEREEERQEREKDRKEERAMRLTMFDGFVKFSDAIVKLGETIKNTKQ